MLRAVNLVVGFVSSLRLFAVGLTCVRDEGLEEMMD